jgi:hypothetical protein
MYFSNHILDKAEILQGNIRYIKIYCGKFSGQMELENITFQRVKFSKLILSNMSNNTFRVLFGTYLELLVEFYFN